MPFETDRLTQDEVHRAEVMSLRIAFAALLHHLVADHPDPDAVYKTMERAIAQITAQTKLQLVPAERHEDFRKHVIDRGVELLKQAQGLRREKRRKPN